MYYKIIVLNIGFLISHLGLSSIVINPKESKKLKNNIFLCLRSVDAANLPVFFIYNFVVLSHLRLRIFRQKRNSLPSSTSRKWSSLVPWFTCVIKLSSSYFLSSTMSSGWENESTTILVLPTWNYSTSFTWEHRSSE
jgi:hypothetical protein